ncbi:amino acid ABC transporter substrate-binding protein [Ottowia flava]|uniref:Amino acid ABC transporter substrate-binding protein n=1 Tax=Ottowia flava TaxID=2675430 RepID=A0ABW4KWC9_9BURK|nr:amino acid ABC transporter substrate-binding protein [Ottowia sp. GY511]
MKRLLALAFGAAAVAVSPLLNAAVLDDIRTRGEVRLGYRPDAPPLSYASPDGTHGMGFAVDLCKAVINDLEQRKLIPAGTKITYVPLSNAARFKAVVDGAVDAECADTTNNRERRDKIGVAFTIPHYYAGVRMLVATKSRIQRPEDLRDKTVLVTKGTTTAKILEERNASLQLNARKRDCDSPSACFKDLADKRGDAYMMDDIQLFALRAQAAQPADWEVVGRLLSIEPLAIMLPKNDPVWKAEFDTVLRRLIRDREFHTMYSHWFERPIPPQNINYQLPMNYLLRDSLKFPSDQIGD